MAQTLRCGCGYEVEVENGAANELTWCPRCHQVLVTPPEYSAAQRTFRRGGAAPSGSSSGGSVAGRIGAGIVLVMILGGFRAACNSSHYEPAPSYTIPDFKVQDNVNWPPPNWQDPPQFPDPNAPGGPILLPPAEEGPRVVQPPDPFRPPVEDPPGEAPRVPEPEGPEGR